jgi:hypothetical protein
MRQERAQQQDLYRSFYSNFSLGVWLWQLLHSQDFLISTVR